MKQALGLNIEAQEDRGRVKKKEKKWRKKKCLETFDCSELKEPRDKNANVTVYQGGVEVGGKAEGGWGGEKLQGRVADRTHTSGCTVQHNSHTQGFTVYAYQQMMKPCPTNKRGDGVCSDAAR